jgi:replicative DNA helicase
MSSGDTKDFLSQAPPAAMETERMLLSAVLKNFDVLPQLIRLVEPRDFHDPRCQAVFTAMRELLSKGTPIDRTTLTNALRRAGQLSSFGGERDAMQYLAETELAIAGWPTAAENYARAIHDVALIREAGQAANRIAWKSFEAGDAGEFLPEAQAELGRIAQRQVTDEPDLPAILDRALEGTANRDRYYLPTGFRDLDGLLDGGLKRGQLIVVGALTSNGKSALSLNIAANVVKAGLPALFLSAEMSTEELGDRLLYGEAGVSLKRRRFLDAVEREKLLTANNRLRDVKLAMRYRPGFRPLDVRAEAQKLRAEWGGLSLIVCDYVNRMRPDNNREQTREREVASISGELKLIAGELGCAVIACAQFNRQINHRDDVEPRLSDFKESGALEQDADIAVLIHQPDPGDETEKRIIVAKNRSGAKGSFTLAFAPELTKFSDSDRPPDSSVPWAKQAA